MSRIGRKEILVPAGVTVSFNDGIIKVKGAKGELSQVIDDAKIGFEIGAGKVQVTRATDEQAVRSKHGLYRVLVANMVEGVSKGFTRVLVVKGIGFKAAIDGTTLKLNIGFSHPCEVIQPEGVSFSVAQVQGTPEVTVSGIDKVKVGQAAANIKSLKKEDPYHGYGIFYKNQKVYRKEIKKASK